MAQKKTNHFNMFLSDEEVDWLNQLAEANTKGNKSMLFHLMLERVWRKPSKLGFIKPIKKEKGE